VLATLSDADLGRPSNGLVEKPLDPECTTLAVLVVTALILGVAVVALNTELLVFLLGCPVDSSTLLTEL